LSSPDSQTLLDLLLMSMAQHYDLLTDAGRAESNKDIVNSFIALNGRINPEVTYEIGAFDARYSVEIRKRLPHVHAIAFEANPYNYASYKNSADILNNGVEYIHSAIANRTGNADFLIQKKLQGEVVDVIRGNNSLLPRTEDGVEYETASVPVTTLKYFAEMNDLQTKLFTAWVDVEGAAEAVLTGADDLWDNCAALMVEVEQHSYWKGQWLCWEVTDHLMQRGFVPVVRDFEYEYQYNIIFIRKTLLKNPGVREWLVKYHSIIARKR
jgi:FkbM family methyltransferase